MRRLVQQEDYALSLMHRAGLPSPDAVRVRGDHAGAGVPAGHRVLRRAVELGEAEIDDQVIDDGLRIVRQLWDAGLAHRDIKPANLLVRDGRLLLIDVAFAEARPSPWRQAVDLANMMLCLALRSDPDRVFRRARQEFSVEEITEGFAAARGLALPSQLRRMMRAQGRDLHAEFVRLLPRPPRPGLRPALDRPSAGAARGDPRRPGAPLRGGDRRPGGPAASPRRHLRQTLACTELEPLWLLAQSVPSAAQVPCVRSLPAGWTLGHVTVNRGRSVLTFDHDRAGAGALVSTFTEACDPGGAAEVGAAASGIRSYQRVAPSSPRTVTTRFDVFPGGCLASRLVAPSDDLAQLAAEIPEVIAFRYAAGTRSDAGSAVERTPAPGFTRVPMNASRPTREGPSRDDPALRAGGEGGGRRPARGSAGGGLPSEAGGPEPGPVEAPGAGTGHLRWCTSCRP